MKLTLILLAVLAPIVFSIEEAAKEVNPAWEFLYLSKESQRHSSEGFATKLEYTLISPDRSRGAARYVGWPGQSSHPSDVAKAWDHTTPTDVVSMVRRFLDDALGENAAVVTYSVADITSGQRESMKVNGEPIILASLCNLTLRLLLAQGWEPISFDKHYLPSWGSSTRIYEEVHVFRRPFLP